jgi:hypothetical protein
MPKFLLWCSDCQDFHPITDEEWNRLIRAIENAEVMAEIIWRPCVPDHSPSSH